MCGISGIFNYQTKQPVLPESLMAMNAALIHRGPDDEGIFQSGPIGMAMRRLAVIDVPHGRQPMSCAEGQIQLIFNGEIYNHHELREKLQRQGVKFKTQSDTEVLLRLYETYGIECVQQLRGMFAFSFWDARKNRLFMARDRLGQKPLYYSDNNGTFAWSSELNSLMKYPGLKKVIDPEGLDLYLALQYIPSPWTIYKNVHKLPPAHMLIFENGKLQIKRFWHLPQNETIKMDYEETKQSIRNILTKAVKLRMVADVPIGAFLSGGVDSSIVVGILAGLASKPIKTFSLGFEDQQYSELEPARRVATHFNTDHTEFILSPNVTDTIPKLAALAGEPFGDSSILPTFFLAKETRKHVTVALSGDGGDENFGGYRRYKMMLALQKINAFPKIIRKTISPLGTLMPHRARRFFQDILPGTPAEQYQQLVGIFPPRERFQMYTQGAREALGTAWRQRSFFEDMFEHGKNLDLLNQLGQVDAETYLPDCLMTKVDRATMAHSLEARSPFLDHEFMEFAAKIPGGWKNSKGDSKRILKDAFRDMVPSEILDREKMGFGIPVNEWFRGPLKNFWEDVVLRNRGPFHEFFEPRALEKVFDDHQRGYRNNGYRLWVLMVLMIQGVPNG